MPITKDVIYLKTSLLYWSNGASYNGRMDEIAANLKLARGTAGKILREFEITNPPVDVAELAESFGFQITEHELDEGISAILNEPEGIIIVNSLHHQLRKRFSIAHELGHHLLGHDNTRLLAEGQTWSEVSRAREREANEFAGELLMPLDMLKQYTASIKDPKRLAGLFEVSEQAMWVQLEKHGRTLKLT